jgi:ProP effector
MSSEKVRSQTAPTVILRKKRPATTPAQAETKPTSSIQPPPRAETAPSFVPPYRPRNVAPSSTSAPRRAPFRGDASIVQRKQPVMKRQAAPVKVPQPPRDPSLPNRKQRDALAQQALLGQFRTRWPQAFPLTAPAIRPLARGIHEQIAVVFPDLPQWLIKQTIARFQRGYDGAYWRAVLKGGPRYALDGEPNGEVTPKEQEQAKANLDALEAQRVASSAQARSTSESLQAASEPSATS